MKRYTSVALAAFLTLPAFAQDDAPAEASADAPAEAPALDPAVIKTNSSYGFGFQTGNRFLSETARYGISGDDIDQEQFAKGFFEAFAGQDPSLPEADLQAAMEALGKLLEQREKDASAANLEAAKAFLAENGEKEGVTTLESGLQYMVVTAAPEGAQTFKEQSEEIQANPQFLVNYRGTLADGTVFDESPEGQPVPFTLGVVDGFKEAITTMPVGAKWKLFIHPDLAYGAQRVSKELGPNSLLIFELELVEIKAAPAAPQGFDPSQLIPQGAGQ